MYKKMKTTNNKGESMSEGTGCDAVRKGQIEIEVIRLETMVAELDERIAHLIGTLSPIRSTQPPKDTAGCRRTRTLLPQQSREGGDAA